MTEAQPVAISSPVWSRPWVQNVSLIVLCALISYGLVYRDVVSRARESFEQGEKYMRWSEHPEEKSKFLEEKFGRDKAELDVALQKNKIGADEYRRKLDVLEFDKKFLMEESALKYAYQWYKDTYQLFSPPESKWVQLARSKAPQALELWKKELREKKIPFEDYMFE